MERRWDKVDGYALAASIAAHVLLFGLIWAGLMRHTATLPQPQPMAVEILAETDLESTSPTPDAEAPAAFQAPEDGPIDDAPAAEALPEPEAVPLPEPTPVPPLPQVKPVPAPPVERTVERVLKKALTRPEPKAVPKPAAKTTPTPTKTVSKAPPAKASPVPAKAAPAKAAPARSAAAKPATKPGTGTGKGSATRPSGDLASIVSGIGKTKNNSASTGAPGAKSAAQIRQSITTSIKSQVEGPWNRCRVTGIDVDALVTTVRFRLDRDGSLAGFSSTTTSGVNDSNRTQQSRHQECAKKAIQQASPFTGLPPEHYSYWQNYEFKFQKR